MQGRDQSIIEHIYNYCKEISEELDQIGNDRTNFLESSVYKNSLALCVLQIGELVTLLSDDYKASKNSVEWKSIKGMRNVVAHKYGKFDFDVLWETVTEDIPKLKAFCESEMGSELNQDPPTE